MAGYNTLVIKEMGHNNTFNHCIEEILLKGRLNSGVSVLHLRAYCSMWQNRKHIITALLL